ncbi:MAG: MM0924 family protein [Methanotrichaceae archaeon]
MLKRPQGGENPMMDKFISEHLYNKDIEVYFGGKGNERLCGKVVGSADGVLVLEKDGRRDYINLERVLTAWEI